MSSLLQYRPEGSSKPSSAIVSNRLSKAQVEAALTACAGKPVTTASAAGSQTNKYTVKNEYY
jgi:hypothetical protein